MMRTESDSRIPFLPVHRLGQSLVLVHLHGELVRFREIGSLSPTLFVLFLGLLSLPIAHAIPGSTPFLRELKAQPKHERLKHPTFVYPLMTTRLTSHYGRRRHPVRGVVRHHHGVDLAAPRNTPIRSIAAGEVIFADEFGGYGNYISIKHHHGYTSHYGHCESIDVQVGQKVNAGERIGAVGSSGVVTGPHLHFELRLLGRSLDPEQFIPDLAEQAFG